MSLRLLTRTCVARPVRTSAVRSVSQSAASRTVVQRPARGFVSRIRSSDTTRVVLRHSRGFVSAAGEKIVAPPMVYIKGEEMTRYAAELYLDHWIRPYVNIDNWEFFDLSCRSRDNTEDQVLHDCIAAGKRIGSIYKEPTVTPTEIQKEEMGLKKAWGSPNGVMRAGWNGISISRDTIHLPGMEMGFKKKCLFDRHAVGGEYSASYKMVGPGTITTTFMPDGGSLPIVISGRKLKDQQNAVVVYDNPYDNVAQMAHHFFSRCLQAEVTPYVVTKKTVFKWQEAFWQNMKKVFDEHYKEAFLAKGLLESCGGELTHFLSDVATMQIIRWSQGGWGMCAHNYDGDVLSDEIAQVHRSPGFLTSVLNGVNDDGTIIKEFEASHGTVTDMWHAHERGEETSLNPLSMMEALIGAMEHSAELARKRHLRTGDQAMVKAADQMIPFARTLQKAIHQQMITPGQGTRDLSGPDGLTTEQFVKAVKQRVDEHAAEAKEQLEQEEVTEELQPEMPYDLDISAMKELFGNIDHDNNGSITFEEFARAMKKLGVAPRKLALKGDVDIKKRRM